MEKKMVSDNMSKGMKVLVITVIILGLLSSIGLFFALNPEVIEPSSVSVPDTEPQKEVREKPSCPEGVRPFVENYYDARFQKMVIEMAGLLFCCQAAAWNVDIAETELRLYFDQNGSYEDFLNYQRRAVSDPTVDYVNESTIDVYMSVLESLHLEDCLCANKVALKTAIAKDFQENKEAWIEKECLSKVVQ